MDWAAVDFWLNTALLLYIANMLFLKAVLLRRESRLGFWLAASNVAFAVGFVATALAAWVPVFASVWWRWGVRVAIAFACTMVIRQFVLTFGGVLPMHREVLRSLRDRPPHGREGY